MDCLPGHGALAIVEQIAILAEHSGSQAAIDATDEATLDLTDPANEVALRALLEQHAALGQYAESVETLHAALTLAEQSGDAARITAALGSLTLGLKA